MRIRRAIALAAVILASAASDRARAQTVFAGGAIQFSIERFDDNEDFNRLDASVPGAVLAGGVRFGRFEARVEGYRNAPAENEDETSVTFGNRTATVRSSLRHHAQAFAAFGGYSVGVPARVQIVGLAGVSYTTVSRTFTTEAGQVLLTPPSTVPAGPTTTRAADRFTSWSVGADGLFSLSPRTRLVAGVRVEPLRVASGTSGRNVRALVGALWTVR
jgi:hypothetical protein